MMRSSVVAFAAVLVLAGCGRAPAVEAPKDTSALANIQVVTSPGGVTAWLVQESFVPIIAMEMAWKGGAASEPDDKLGASWVLGYMMNEGAGDLNTQAYGARMEDLNMSFGCNITLDWSMCSLSTLKDTSADAFEMTRLALTEPRFDEEPLDRAKRELVVSLQEAETDPDTLAGRALNAALLPGHPYARVVTEKTANAITRDDMVALKQSFMTKDRLLVTVVGDISAAELAPKLDQLFGALPATSTLTPVPDVETRPPPADPLVVDLDLAQTLVEFSGPGIRRDDPDFYAAYVLNYILGGGGFSSRLMDDIREQKGLTYGISTWLSLQDHQWRWNGQASTRHETAKEVIQLVKNHIASLGAEGPTEGELADAKAYLTGAYPLNFDTNRKIAGNLMSVRQDGLDVSYLSKRNDLINAVTLDDLKRVAARYMKPEAFAFVMVGRPE
jgi:zinc protease